MGPSVIGTLGAQWRLRSGSLRMVAGIAFVAPPSGLSGGRDDCGTRPVGSLALGGSRYYCGRFHRIRFSPQAAVPSVGRIYHCSWQAVWELSARDGADNAAQGSVLFVDAGGCYVAADKQLVAVYGLQNVVIVTTADAVLVAKREDGDGLRRVVQKLKDVAPAVTEDHLQVHRPWGSYHSLDQGERFQVKRIVVKQGGRLSLQMHHHRAEHWVVVRGTARVTIDDAVKILHENEFDLCAERRAPSVGKSGQDRPRIDRGPDRLVSRRGRHRPVRGRLSQAQEEVSRTRVLPRAGTNGFTRRSVRLEDVAAR